MEDRFVLTVDGDDRSITCDRTQRGATMFHAEFPSMFPSMDRADLPPGSATSLDMLIVVDSMIIENFAAGGLVTFTEHIFPAEPFDALRVESLTDGCQT